MGLLLLRLTAGIVLFARALAELRVELAIGTLLPAGLRIAGRILLVAGLWTPVAGSVVALLGLWHTISLAGDPWGNILLAAVGASLALLGPGAWSVDARLFGWKRIDLKNRPG